MVKPAKVIVLGAKGTGKTSILEQIMYGNVVPSTRFSPTIEDIYSMAIPTDRGTRERVKFFDTSGLELRQKPDVAQYVPIADGYVLVYNVNNKESFGLVDAIKKEIDKTKEKKELPVVVLANKVDTPPNERQVDASYAQNWAAREKVRLYEVTVFDQEHLRDAFVYLTSRLHSRGSSAPGKPSSVLATALSMGRKHQT